MNACYNLILFSSLFFVLHNHRVVGMEEEIKQLTNQQKKIEGYEKLARLLIKLHDCDKSEFFNEILREYNLNLFKKEFDVIIHKFKRNDIAIEVLIYLFNQPKEVLFCYFEYAVYLLNFFLREDLQDFKAIDKIYKVLPQWLKEIFLQEQQSIKFASNFESSAQKIIHNFRNNYSSRMGRLYTSLYKDQIDKILNSSGISAEELACYIFEYYDNYFHKIEEGIEFLDFLFPDICDSNDNATLKKILDTLAHNHIKFSSILNTYIDFVEFCPRTILFISELKKLVKEKSRYD